MIPLVVVDAFTEQPFCGNPAAVLLLEHWLSDSWLQLVAREMNLSETAFLVPRQENEFELRWFTPMLEVALCGHATLASAHALWESGHAERREVGFHTKSGRLTAMPSSSGEIGLNFPAKPATTCEPPPGLLSALGVTAVATGRNEFDYIVELSSETKVRSLTPHFGKLREVECRGVIAS